jgi:hemerythrin
MGEAMKQAVHAKPLKTGEKATDTEHDLQLQLIDSLAESIEKGSDFSPARYVLDQFIEFSDMHFLSEQLVMRLHNYPGYEPHLEEHTKLMKKVRDIRDSVVRGDQKLSQELVEGLREWLLTHIATKDVAFGEFLKSREERSQ